MKCLLAVGICSSDKELAVRESGHICNGETEKSKFVQVESQAILQSLIKRTLNRLVAGLPRHKPPKLYRPYNG